MSFLARLAGENGLPHDSFLTLPSTLRVPTVAVITALTGRPAGSLKAGLPELHIPQIRPDNPPHKLAGFEGEAYACELCVASHGSAIHAVVWTNSQDAVCQRHHRWVGSALLHSLGQIALRRAPEILAANRRHRGLVHRHGQHAASAAFTDAFGLINDLCWRGDLPGAEELILRLADKDYVQTSSVAPEVLAARYPATVGLTSVLIHSDWVRHATANPRNWQAAKPQLAAAIGVGCRLSDSTYRQLSRWFLD